ncbi:uncharacterized protein MONBRDRAFT_31278 [Monosiga brevicollis MX1]|uniref:tRNA (32-2'-O)-methyltransferase regulator THADA-like C-terminal TPR repeats region domain-containing protein n=1 Tax=Monosiga brevicollis TaxID=81824 RepID=A9USU0_MONBE|nr:uncharacterized protein MONBRDRAFT_31278 [Monosiga brevicollis MX1]EDQ92162.1 predicted protein [Monosiga brevicollis MX1]|eukprot:XP_001743448.1 hypothetical protein [Monosiga brevicollis MX1]
MTYMVLIKTHASVNGTEVHLPALLTGDAKAMAAETQFLAVPSLQGTIEGAHASVPHIRGLLALLPREQLVARPSTTSENDSTPLFERLVSALLLRASPDQTLDTRIAAYQTLNVAASLLVTQVTDAPDLSAFDVASLVTELLNCSMEGADDKVAVIKSQARSIFSKLLRLLRSGQEQLLETLTRGLAAMPADSKRRYALLARLVNEFGFDFWQSRFVDLPAMVAAGLEYHGTVQAASSVYRAAIKAYTFPTDLPRWRASWANLLVDLLSRREAAVALTVRELWLPDTARASPLLLPCLREELTARKVHLDYSSLLQGLLLVAAAARQEGQLPDDIWRDPATCASALGLDYASLQSAFLHQDENIRFTAAALVLAAPQTIHVPETCELDLFCQFVSQNLNCPWASARQRTLTLVRQFWQRLLVSEQHARQRHAKLEAMALRRADEDQALSPEEDRSHSEAFDLTDAAHERVEIALRHCQREALLSLSVGTNAQRSGQGLKLLLLLEDMLEWTEWAHADVVQNDAHALYTVAFALASNYPALRADAARVLQAWYPRLAPTEQLNLKEFALRNMWSACGAPRSKDRQAAVAFARTLLPLPVEHTIVVTPDPMRTPAHSPTLPAQSADAEESASPLARLVVAGAPVLLSLEARVTAPASMAQSSCVQLLLHEVRYHMGILTASTDRNRWSRHPLDGWIECVQEALLREPLNKEDLRATFELGQAVLAYGRAMLALDRGSMPSFADMDGAITDCVEDDQDTMASDNASYAMNFAWTTLRAGSALLATVVQVIVGSNTGHWSMDEQVALTQTVTEGLRDILASCRHRGIIESTAGTLLQQTRKRHALVDTMAQLEGIARLGIHFDASDETLDPPQMLAFYVLKLVLGDRTLSAATEHSLAHCARLAIDGFRASTWLIRNASLQLFSQAIERIFESGPNESGCLPTTDFARRYRVLWTRLQQEITDLAKHCFDLPFLLDQPHLMPLLLMLARLRGALNADDVVPEGLWDSLARLAQCPSYHARTRAAIALARLGETPRLLDTTEVTTPNALHGALLCAHAALKRGIVWAPAVGNCLRGLQSKLGTTLDSMCLHAWQECFLALPTEWQARFETVSPQHATVHVQVRAQAMEAHQAHRAQSLQQAKAALATGEITAEDAARLLFAQFSNTVADELALTALAHAVLRALGAQKSGTYDVFASTEVVQGVLQLKNDRLRQALFAVLGYVAVEEALPALLHRCMALCAWDRDPVFQLAAARCMRGLCARSTANLEVAWARDAVLVLLELAEAEDDSIRQMACKAWQGLSGAQLPANFVGTSSDIMAWLCTSATTDAAREHLLVHFLERCDRFEALNTTKLFEQEPLNCFREPLLWFQRTHRLAAYWGPLALQPTTVAQWRSRLLSDLENLSTINAVTLYAQSERLRVFKTIHTLGAVFCSQHHVDAEVLKAVERALDNMWWINTDVCLGFDLRWQLGTLRRSGGTTMDALDGAGEPAASPAQHLLLLTALLAAVGIIKASEAPDVEQIPSEGSTTDPSSDVNSLYMITDNVWWLS